MSFKELSLIEPLLKALETEGYEHPTPIQSQAIPPVLQGRDLLGCAQTGTGKTAAFALPMLQILHNEKRAAGAHSPQRAIRALVLTPTRELAIQIGDSFSAYGRYTGVRNLVIFGGVSQHAQTEALRRGTDILVATPGRLLDLMNQGFISLRDIGIFVLDEADRMLDMGFIHDVKKVIAKLPAKRQTLFFSATMPPEIAQLAGSILTNPVRVEVTPVSSTAEKVAQEVFFVGKKDKKYLLIHLLKDPAISSALVFTRTKHGANKVAGDLNKAGIRAEAIHGNKSQNARQAALQNFKSGRNRILVATDIAARGIDIEELSHVVNFDLPNIPETYVHRIGRTGRAGASGIALSFCDEEELAYLKDIQKLTGQLVPVQRNHPFVLELEAPGLPQLREGNSRNPNNGKYTGQAPQHRAPAHAKNAGGQSVQKAPPQPKQTFSQKPSPAQKPPFREKNTLENQALAKPDSDLREYAPARPEIRTSVASADNRKRFSSILEVATIEKQEFTRKSAQRKEHAPHSSAALPAMPKNDSAPGGNNRRRRKNRRRQKPAALTTG